MAITIGCKDLFIGDCEGTLATVPVSGGAPREIATSVLSADWIADGSTMAVIRDAGGRFRVEFPPGKVPGRVFQALRDAAVRRVFRKGFYKDGRFRETTFITESIERSACFRKEA